VNRDIDALALEFERCKQWIVDALEYNGGEVSVAAVWDGIKSGDFQLMPGLNSVIVLEPVHHSSGKKVLNYFLAGGDLEELQDMERHCSGYAKQMGYDSVSIFGRRGWLKRLSGFTEKAVFMEKKLNG
jgi:hypothetical protein